MWVVLAIGLFTEMPIRQVFKASRKLRKDEVSPARYQTKNVPLEQMPSRTQKASSIEENLCTDSSYG